MFGKSTFIIMRDITKMRICYGKEGIIYSFRQFYSQIEFCSFVWEKL
jgi:hypothetical protein